MADSTLPSPRPHTFEAQSPGADPTLFTGILPEVRMEIRHGSAPPASFEMIDSGFLIGTAPGCDIRLPSSDLPPVLCLITRTTGGVGIRKMVPTAPLLVNGKPVSMGILTHGDRIGIGGVELSVNVEVSLKLKKLREKNGDSLFPPAPFPVFKFSPQELEERSRQLDAREQLLDEKTAELETDRVIWYRRREEIEQECRLLKEQERDISAARITLEKDRQVLQPEQDRLARQQAELQAKAEHLIAQEKELDAYRHQLDDRYRERRDRLAGLQEAVNKAASNVQERKRQLEAEIQQAAANLQDHGARKSELEGRASELDQKTRDFEEQRAAFASRQEGLQKQQDGRLSECQARERQLIEDRQTLEQNQTKYQNDLVRLDRLAASLEQKQKDLQNRSTEIDRRSAELQQTIREMESQALEMKKLENRLHQEASHFAERKTAHDAVSAETAQRTAQVETQQVLLATLRTRLEKQKDDLRREEQSLIEQRNRQQETEADLQRRFGEVQRLRAKWEDEQRHHDQERQQIQDRAAAMETAVDRLRELEEKLTEEKLQLDRWSEELNANAARQAEEADSLEARTGQIVQMGQKIADDRQILRERETALVQAEQARESLQEQLRLRSEELTIGHRDLADQTRLCKQQASELDARQSELEHMSQETEQRLASLQQELDARTVVLNQLQSDLNAREHVLTEDLDRLKTTARNLDAGQKTLVEAQTRWSAQQQEAALLADRGRAELKATREELVSLQQHLPELEQQARGAAQKLSEARKQLREHLAELHTYANQAQEDLESLRAQVRLEAEQLRQQEMFLRKAREDQRLAVASFRQQLIDYQGQLTEMKRTLDQGESRLERRQAEVNKAAEQIDATSARLAKQAEEIQEQERAVAERRDEMERHLADMREWYRRKLRELADANGAASATSGADESRVEDGVPTESGDDGEATGARHILPMTEEIDEGDQKLGDLLQSYELVESETLSQLLVEAKKQRRSLRQMLLASGFVTLYQMAMIEAGNFDSLVLGPVRVLDRLRVMSQETVYRVFDPRRIASSEPGALGTGASALLRHLSESAMTEVENVEEFRTGFTAASKVTHENLAATWQVLDIQGRPAVLQEWLTGLPSSDWPSLASVPSVWLRLLRQTAQGMHAAHSAGLTHGHLQANRILLTAEGVVKIAGFGEPDWLVGSTPKSSPVVGDHWSMSGQENDSLSPNHSLLTTDLADLCRIGAAWAAPSAKKKGVKTKPFPKALRNILDRLKSEDAESRYADTSALLADLDQASDHVTDNSEAWEKLLSHIRDQGKDEVPMKQSA
jgi:chromosome segregation ATPase